MHVCRAVLTHDKAGKTHDKLFVVHFPQGAQQRPLGNILHSK
jgi:hypothetical protein